MPSFKSGAVVRLLEERAGLQRVEVDLGNGPERAYVLTQLTGRVDAGDDVVVNTTAVELGLGTGGWHVVHWNLTRREWNEPGPGHIIKARYTSLQTDVGSTEEHFPELADITSIDKMPVVAAALHSQLPAIAIAYKQRNPKGRLAYIMTDGAALPLALSDLVAQLREKDLVDVTITCGHAFGGDLEAVSVYSALAAARFIANAAAAVVCMGPGIVGTATRLGFTGIEVAPILDAVDALDGVPIIALRMSDADPRERHRGVSHHTLTALAMTRSSVVVPWPAMAGRDHLDDFEPATVAWGDRNPFAKHEIVHVEHLDMVKRLDAHGLRVVSMGRAASEDPVLFEAAGAAGWVAAERIP
ncbi:MAG TPA: DUF3866 family protein [Acidimicrobiia bacterium]|nr:DUF3866 family protein [Acidimicrobiia bacterium]